MPGQPGVRLEYEPNWCVPTNYFCSTRLVLTSVRPAGHRSDDGFAIYNRPSDNAKRIMAAAAQGGAPAAAAMASSASAVVVSSSSDVPMPKKRKVAPDMDDALRFAPQRIMKDMMPILMMMMSMMPVMMSQVTQMAARHVAHLCRGRRVRANTSRAEKQRFRGSHALLMQKAPRGFLLVQ